MCAHSPAPAVHEDTGQATHNTEALREQLKQLQERNLLLRQLRAAQEATKTTPPQLYTPKRRDVVKHALRNTRDQRNLTNKDLEAIVDIATQRRPCGESQGRSPRRPLALADVNQPAAPPQPRLKLKLSELAPREPDLIPQTARTSSDWREKPQPATEEERPLTARLATTHRTAATSDPASKFNTGTTKPNTARYNTLLQALKLEGSGYTEGAVEPPKDGWPVEPPTWLTSKASPIEPYTEGNPALTDAMVSDAHVKSEELREKLASKPAGRESQASRPRCHSAPASLNASIVEETKEKLKAEGGKGRWTLPGSPCWTDDMNKSNQPDGEFSREKKEVFKRGVRQLLRSVVGGGTLLETKVSAKRSKQAAQMWGHEREARKQNLQRQPAGGKAAGPWETRGRRRVTSFRR